MYVGSNHIRKTIVGKKVTSIKKINDSIIIDLEDGESVVISVTKKRNTFGISSINIDAEAYLDGGDLKIASLFPDPSEDTEE
jgi:hypothetical protein